MVEALWDSRDSGESIGSGPGGEKAPRQSPLTRHKSLARNLQEFEICPRFPALSKRPNTHYLPLTLITYCERERGGRSSALDS